MGITLKHPKTGKIFITTNAGLALEHINNGYVVIEDTEEDGICD